MRVIMLLFCVLALVLNDVFILLQREMFIILLRRFYWDDMLVWIYSKEDLFSLWDKIKLILADDEIDMSSLISDDSKLFSLSLILSLLVIRTSFSSSFSSIIS